MVDWDFILASLLQKKAGAVKLTQFATGVEIIMSSNQFK